MGGPHITPYCGTCFHISCWGRPFREILLMQSPHVSEVRLKWRLEALRQHSDSVLTALAIANNNGGLLKVHILDSHAESLHESQPAAVKNLPHQCRRALQVEENLAYFIFAEYHRQTPRPMGPYSALQAPDITTQYRAVEKQQCSQCLILAGCAQLFLYSQMGEEGVDPVLTHLLAIAIQQERSSGGSIHGSMAILS